MEKTTKDRALMQALAPKEPRQLPSNFPYVTMRRIKEEQRLKESRQRRTAIITIIAVALTGISTLLFLFGDALWQSLVSISHQPEAFSLVWPTLFCLVFLASVNHWLARQYKKQEHKSQHP
jgi:cell division protein FtsB